VILFCIITGLLNTITSVGLGLMLLVRGRRGSANLSLFLFLIAGAGWSGSYVLWLWKDDAGSALFWSRMLSVFAILIPPAYMHFCVRLVGEKRHGVVAASYAAGLALAALCATPWIVSAVEPHAEFPFWPRPGAAYPVYMTFFAGLTVASWLYLYRATRRASGTRRNQLRFALISTVVGFCGGSTNFFYWFDIPIPPVGNLFIPFYLAGVAYTIIGLRLLELNYVVTKIIVYLLVALPLALIHPVLVLALLGMTSGIHEALIATTAMSVLLSFFAILLMPRLKRRVDLFLEATVLRRFYAGRDRLRAFGNQLATFHEEVEVLGAGAEAVSSALGVGASFYMRAELDRIYCLRASRGVPPGIEPQAELSEVDPLIELARRGPVAHVIDETIRLEPELLPRLAGHRAKYRIEVVVPIHSADALVGVLLLSGRERHRVYSDNEITMLEALCQQIGLQVRARELERRVNQTEKLISLGTLAAGLAHELRNPLVSIKTFAQLLDESPGDPELQREFSATVMRDVGRVESIVENVAAFATDRKVSMAWIRLEDVVRGAYEIVRPAYLEAGVAFVFEPEDVPEVHGNSNQLTQVVINLLNNAVQALAGRDGARVLVRLRRRSVAGERSSVELIIVDNGPGLHAEIRDHIFEPFTTTKNTGDRARKGGMGLGLAIVKRIIDGHNGIIRVDSEPDQGARFTIVFPTQVEED